MDMLANYHIFLQKLGEHCFEHAAMQVVLDTEVTCEPALWHTAGGSSR